MIPAMAVPSFGAIVEMYCAAFALPAPGTLGDLPRNAVLGPNYWNIDLALSKIREADVRTAWSSSSLPGAPSDPLPSDPAWAGGSLYTDERSTVVHASPADLWRVIEGLGGDRGYYSFPAAWAARGWIDRAVGGVGLSRGRRDPNRLRVGDPLDFWRVEERIPEQLLRLRGEFRMPGLAWLELGIRVEGEGTSNPTTVYTQRALFHPRGLSGESYWKAMLPFHGVIFGSMLRNIRERAERLSENSPASSDAIRGA